MNKTQYISEKIETENTKSNKMTETSFFKSPPGSPTKIVIETSRSNSNSRADLQL